MTPSVLAAGRSALAPSLMVARRPVTVGKRTIAPSASKSYATPAKYAGASISTSASSATTSPVAAAFVPSSSAPSTAAPSVGGGGGGAPSFDRGLAPTPARDGASFTLASGEIPDGAVYALVAAAIAAAAYLIHRRMKKS